MSHYLSWASDYIFPTAAFQMHLSLRIIKVLDGWMDVWLAFWMDGQMERWITGIRKDWLRILALHF